MPLEYNPKDVANCVPAGEYDAELVKVEDKVSQTSGNPMQVWTFRVFADREIFVTEYVVVPQTTFKIKQLAKALGREADFNAGRFQAEEHVGAGVKLDLTVESQQGYEDKNKVGKIKAAAPDNAPAAAPAPARALPPRPQRQPAPNPVSGEQVFKDDDIPF